MQRSAVVFLLLVSLSLAGELALATTVGAGSELVPLGSAVEVPITLSSASHGLSEFTITVSLANGDVADVERVELPAAFNKTATVEIAPDFDSVTISASDVDDLIEAGTGKVELARVVFRGTFQGHSAVQVAIGRLINDSGNSIVSIASEGELEVTGGPTTEVATVVAGSDGVKVNETVATPIILTQAPNGLSAYQLTVRLADSATSYEFTRVSHGTLWDGETFSVDLGEAGISLADGKVTVEVSAADGGGHLGTTSWNFTVSIGGGPPPPPAPPPAEGGVVCDYAGADKVIDGSDQGDPGLCPRGD